MKKTFALISLGCAKNQVDAETMSGILMDAGYESAPDPAQADVIIVNTCGFIQSAKEEGIETIFDMAAHKKGRCKSLIVTGCLSQRYGEQMLAEMPEANAFAGVGHIGEIQNIVERTLAGERFFLADKPYSFVRAKRAISSSPRYAYLKVADGCDNRCAYCAIPGIRGGYISRPIDDVLAEARELAASGFTEIIPIAQDTTRYGLDLYGRPKLIELLEGLNGIPGVRWIRPMYFYPDLVTDELITAMHGLPKVCNYIDLPIQHIDEQILASMNRRADSALIKNVIARIRQSGDFALRTTLIVGFPGETKEQFDALVRFIKETPFDRLGAFAYSPEEDTPAASFAGQLAKSVKNSRQSRIMSAQRAISAQLLKRRVGTQCEVVVESRAADGRYVGRSMQEAPEVDGCVYISGEGLDIGQYAQVRITGSCDYDLAGVVL